MTEDNFYIKNAQRSNDRRHLKFETEQGVQREINQKVEKENSINTIPR